MTTNTTFCCRWKQKGLHDNVLYECFDCMWGFLLVFFFLNKTVEFPKEDLDHCLTFQDFYGIEPKCVCKPSRSSKEMFSTAKVDSSVASTIENPLECWKKSDKNHWVWRERINSNVLFVAALMLWKQRVSQPRNKQNYAVTHFEPSHLPAAELGDDLELAWIHT